MAKSSAPTKVTKLPGSGLAASTTGILASLSFLSGSTIATSSTGIKTTASGRSFDTCSTIAFCSSTLSGCIGTKWTIRAPVACPIWSAARRNALYAGLVVFLVNTAIVMVLSAAPEGFANKAIAPDRAAVMRPRIRTSRIIATGFSCGSRDRSTAAPLVPDETPRRAPAQDAVGKREHQIEIVLDDHDR